MPKPSKSAKKCGLHQLPDTVGKDKSHKKIETVSLFEMKTVYGWWPVAAMEDGELELTVTQNNARGITHGTDERAGHNNVIVH